MTQEGGAATAAERIEEVCSEIKRLLATIEAQARVLQEKGEDDERR